MPVDFCVCLVPLFFLAACVGIVASRKNRKLWTIAAGTFLALFLLMYFVPGWILWVGAQRGDRDAQYRLGNYYWTRLGYNWSDLEARDKWWVEAAKQGHPRAMQQVGYFSMFGSSRHIPRDLIAARKWLEAAHAAGDPDAEGSLKTLSAEEAKVVERKAREAATR